VRVARALSVAAVPVLCLAVGGGAFLVGRDTAPDEDDAVETQASAYDAAVAESRRSAALASRERGMLAGQKVGRIAGTDAGSSDGAADGQAEAEAELAALGPCPSPDPDLCPLGTIGPEPQGTYCPPPFSYDMGVCNVVRPARPEECPPGWEPAGLTGACAPRD
jgi:hypothetical protein